MPALVLVGAQWGDEGKGKATDLLGGHVDYVVKFNGGNNAGHTVVVGEETYALHLLPERHPLAGLHAGHRQRRRRRPGRAVRGDRRAGGPRRRHLAAAGQRRRAPHPAVQPHARPGRRALPRQPPRSARPGAASARPTPTRWTGSASACRTCSTRGSCARRSRARSRMKNQVLVKVYNRKAIDADAVVEELLAYAERLAPMVADTSLLLNRALDDGRDGAARGRPGDAARRRPRHLPVRHRRSSATAGGACTGSGIGPTPDRQGHRDRQGVHDPRRRGPVPDRAARRDGERLRTVGARVSARPPAGRVAAAGSTRSSPGTPRGSTASPTSSSPSSTCSPGWEQIPVCVAYEVDGKRLEEMPMTQTDFHHAEPVYELARLDRGHLRRAHLRGPAGDRQAYVRALETMCGAPISAVGVGPDREQTLVAAPARLTWRSSSSAPARASTRCAARCAATRR